VVRVLRLAAGQAESLWDEALPIEVRALPRDLAALDELLSDPGLLDPIVERFRREVVQGRRAVLTDGRPTIAMETYVRLMVLKQRYRRGYRTLVAEVSDSIHLRRFWRISLSERVPDESVGESQGACRSPAVLRECPAVVVMADHCRVEPAFE
jgi:transposase, IS5 family